MENRELTFVEALYEARKGKKIRCVDTAWKNAHALIRDGKLRYKGDTSPRDNLFFGNDFQGYRRQRWICIE